MLKSARLVKRSLILLKIHQIYEVIRSYLE
jgi:hypothetical protein